MTWWRAAGAIAAKDLRIEWRHRTAVATALVFGVLGLTVFVFARDEFTTTLTALAPAALWIVIVFTIIVTLNRGFLLEREHRAFDAMRLSPIPREAIFWGKWLANTVLVLAVEVVLIPLWVLFFNVPPEPALLGVGLVALATTLGITAAGTLFSALAVRTRFGELILPVLLLPFAIPPLYFASRATVGILADGAIGGAWSWLRLLALYDLAFLVLGAMLAGAILDE